VIADALVAARAAFGRADSCSELAPHPATTQTTQSKSFLTQPFMRRTT
jgi:hypothetical protein